MAFLGVLLGSSKSARPLVVRQLTWSDLLHSLKAGYEDFLEVPTHVVLIALIYAVVCIFLIAGTFHYPMLPLAFPITAGLAFVAPVAASGLYELSRCREAKLNHSWTRVLKIVHSPSLGAIIVFGLLLAAICLTWLWVASASFTALFDTDDTTFFARLVNKLLKTPIGWSVIVIETAVGCVFAGLLFTISVIALPLLLDRNVGTAVALLASIRVVAANPAMMARWGLIVMVMLVIGAMPFFVCWAVVVPVLGHASWHLYRRAIEPDARSSHDIAIRHILAPTWSTRIDGSHVA
jgi:uncharacterized membrane protein